MALTPAQEARIAAAKAFDLEFMQELRVPGSSALPADVKARIAARPTSLSVNDTLVGSAVLQELRTAGSSSLSAASKARIAAAKALNPYWQAEFRGDVTPPPPPPPPPGPISLANINRLLAEGWEIPDPNTWWDTDPTPAEIKAVIIDPQQNDAGGIVTKRLWMPRLLQTGNYDPARMAECIATTSSMHRRAMRAWYYNDVLGDTTTFATAMNEAKAAFNTQCDAKIAGARWTSYAFPSFFVSSARCRDAMTALAALDWIKWNNAAEFEAAFEKVRQLIAKINLAEEEVGSVFRLLPPGHPAAANPPDGYINASQAMSSGFFLEPMLAFVAYGINPSGASHTWANDKIDHIGEDPFTMTTAVYSPWQQNNFLNLLSLGNGGGREWGAEAVGPSLGGYEEYYAFSATILPWAVDTATNNHWNLRTRSLYLNTRWKGLCVMEDQTVEQVAFSSNCAGMVETWARMYRDTEAGRKYAWLTTRPWKTHSSISTFKEHQALAGIKASPEAPSGTFADRVGSWWFYKEDQGQPDSSFRVFTHYRSLDCHRETGEDRTLGFAIGGIGLVSGHCNRAVKSGVLSNGIWFGTKSSAGDPIPGDASYWARIVSEVPYGSNLRFTSIANVANNIAYLKGTQQKPVLAAGVYTWTRDWSDIWLGPSAVTSYALDTINRTLTLEDEVVYDWATGTHAFGWYFSPSQMPTLIANGFEFTDGTDLIRVTIEALNGFTFASPRIKTDSAPFNCGTYTLQIEWHKTSNGGFLNRIAANVGYSPSTKRLDNTYRVRTIIAANP